MDEQGMPPEGSVEFTYSFLAGTKGDAERFAREFGMGRVVKIERMPSNGFFFFQIRHTLEVDSDDVALTELAQTIAAARKLCSHHVVVVFAGAMIVGPTLSETFIKRARAIPMRGAETLMVIGERPESDSDGPDVIITSR